MCLDCSIYLGKREGKKEAVLIVGSFALFPTPLPHIYVHVYHLTAMLVSGRTLKTIFSKWLWDLSIAILLQTNMATLGNYLHLTAIPVRILLGERRNFTELSLTKRGGGRCVI